MSKLYRSLLWSGLVVAGVAACGDDVTVAPPPPPPPPTVHSVSVAPNPGTIQAGSTLQMVASVNADAGVATTVTWTSSDATRGTVSSSGLVTSPANAQGGTFAITACSTVATGVCGQATVTVGASAPAVISIKSITAGGTFFPVNLANVAGQIDVTLNLDAGTQTVSNVQVLIDGAVACEQSFSAIQAQAAKAALKAGADSSSASLVVEIVCSINTAGFDPATGLAKYFNGQRQVSARVNLVGSAPVATPSTTLTFNNASGFVVSLVTVNAPAANSAIDPRTGLAWLGGSVTLNFIGVSYINGVTISNVTIPLFGKTISTALTAGVGSVTLTEATTWTAGNLGVGNYLSLATGEPVPFGVAVLSNGSSLPPGNPILNLLLPPAGAPTIAPLGTVRLDNTAPSVTSANGVVQLAINPLGAGPTWVNATTDFSAGNQGVPSLATLNSLTAGLGNDPEEGVDAISVTFNVTPAGGALSGASGSCSLTGTTPLTIGSQLAATTVSTSFRVRVAFTDALGNVFCSDLMAGTPNVVGGQFGADFIAPTGTVTGPAAGPPGLNVGPGNFAVAASDNASGFDPAGALLVTMTRLNVGGTTTCLIGSATGCVLPEQQLLTFDATGGADVEGYYTTSITLVDQAGNETVLVTARLYEYDITNPAFSGGVSLPSLIAGAATNTFTATATDNLDLNTILGDVTYPLAVLRYPSQSIGSWGPPLETSAVVPYAVANWIRCINAAGSFAVASGPPTSITMRVTDQALNNGALASAAFGANAQACTGAVGNVAINFFNHLAPSYGTGLTQVDRDGAGLAAISSSTVTLSAVADVPLNTSLDPFARVDFYYVTGGVHIKIGTGSVVLAQTLTNRTYTYSFVWDPDAAVPTGAITVVALGVDDQGDAVFGSGAQVVTVVP